MTASSTPPGTVTASVSTVDARAGTVFGDDVVARAAEVIARYPRPRSALLPLLHLVQSVEGYVSQHGIEFCAAQLDMATAEVSAVATFYTMFKRRPCGEHLVSVCTNTLCAALGGDDIFGALKRHLGVGHNETAGQPGEPGSVTLEHAECLAACDLGPVLQVNYEFFDKQTVDSALGLVQALQRGERPHPTRGAPLTNLRDVELQLAGFFDGDGRPRPAGRTFAEEVDGPSAAVETLRGAKLANERGWNAPPMPDDVGLAATPPEKKKR